MNLFRLVVASVLSLISMFAHAQYEDSGQPTEQVWLQVDRSITLLEDGAGGWRMLDSFTGETITDGQGAECRGSPSYLVGSSCLTQLFPGLVVGVVIGAISGSVAVAAGGGNAGQIIAGTLLGGVSGFYGSIAAVTTGVSRVIWGANAVAVGGGGGGLVGRTTP